MNSDIFSKHSYILHLVMGLYYKKNNYNYVYHIPPNDFNRLDIEAYKKIFEKVKVFSPTVEIGYDPYPGFYHLNLENINENTRQKIDTLIRERKFLPEYMYWHDIWIQRETLKDFVPFDDNTMRKCVTIYSSDESNYSDTLLKLPDTNTLVRTILLAYWNSYYNRELPYVSYNLGVFKYDNELKQRIIKFFNPYFDRIDVEVIPKYDELWIDAILLSKAKVSLQQLINRNNIAEADLLSSDIT